MKSQFASLVFASVASGCVISPLPDGSHIARLSPEQLQMAAPAVSPEERDRLQKLDARVRDEQQRAAAEEERFRLWQEEQRLRWEYYGGYGWGPGPWYRDGHRRWGGGWWDWPY
jgi:hypothetical protein